MTKRDQSSRHYETLMYLTLAGYFGQNNSSAYCELVLTWNALDVDQLENRKYIIHLN